MKVENTHIKIRGKNYHTVWDTSSGHQKPRTHTTHISSQIHGFFLHIAWDTNAATIGIGSNESLQSGHSNVKAPQNRVLQGFNMVDIIVLVFVRRIADFVICHFGPIH